MTQILRTSKDVRIIDNRLGFTTWRWHREDPDQDRSLLLFAHDNGPVHELPQVFQLCKSMDFMCPTDLALYSDFDIAIQYYEEFPHFLRVGCGDTYQNRYLQGFSSDELLAANDAVRRVIWRIELEQVRDTSKLPDLAFVHACAANKPELDLASVIDVLPDIDQYQTLAVHTSRRMFTPDESAVVYVPKPVLKHKKQRKDLQPFG